MNWYENGRKGAIGELVAAVDLMQRGYEVFRAVDPVASTDLIAHYKGDYWRIQVKTGLPGLTEVKAGRQEVVAWVNVNTNEVSYDPEMPRMVRAMSKTTEPRKVAFDDRDETTAKRIAAVVDENHKNRNVGWFAMLHCENKPMGRATDRYSCDVREITLYVKEFPNDPPVIRGPFVCPACGYPATLKSIRTTRQWDDDENQQARFRVNLQVEERRQKEAGQKIPVVNLLAVSHHDLAGWTDCESPLIES